MKKQIKIKILTAFLSVSLLSVIVVGVVAEVNLLRMNSLMTQSTGQIGNQSSETSEKLLINQAISTSKQLAQEKADLVNQQLTELATTLKTFANYTEYLYENRSAFSPVPVLSAPQVVERGLDNGFTAQYALSPGKTLAEVQDELYLQGNLMPLFTVMAQNNPNITSIYTASVNGFTIGYDKNAAMKAEVGTYYEIRERDWYLKAKETGKLYIPETYGDLFGRGLTVTMALPFYSGGEFAGVVGIDILIEQLNQDILNMNIGDGGYAMLFSEEGSVISAPGLTDGNANDLSFFLGDNADTIATDMQTNREGVSQSRTQNGEVYILYNTIELTGWRFALALPVSGIIAPADEAKENIQQITETAQKAAGENVLIANVLILLLFAVVVLAVVLVTLRVSKKITHPITQLSEDVRKIGDGDLSYTSNIHTGDEIESLSQSFEHMTVELKEYIENLSKVTADKERIATELSVATQIQTSMLPCIFPAFPEREDFDVYASMLAAKEVGGDFYDFFLIDDTHLGVVIADVSGKGVPAALFMVIAKTLIKNHAQMGKPAGTVFETVNNQLCENNEAGMFVTAFMGILDLQTGKLTYVNAGHNAPLVEQNGKYEWLKARAGFVLAGMEGMRYREASLDLTPGDRIFLYTDGVTEATNAAQELYSDPRLYETINQTSGMSLTDTLRTVKADIDGFVGDAPQFDDITMLVLEFKGKQDRNKPEK